MNTHISIGEVILISVFSIFVYAAVAATMDLIKEKYSK